MSFAVSSVVRAAKAIVSVSWLHLYRGIGSALHDALLDGVGTRTAMLSTLQEETGASGCTKPRDGRRCGRMSGSEAPAPYRLMGLRLKDA